MGQVEDEVGEIIRKGWEPKPAEDPIAKFGRAMDSLDKAIRHLAAEIDKLRDADQN